MMHGAELLNIAAPVAAKIDWAQTATVVISGIVIVMLVLVVLIFIFKGFGAIMSKTGKSSKAKNKSAKAPAAPAKKPAASPAKAPVPAVPAASGIDPAVVAAISAAVSAYEGGASFTVRAIRVKKPAGRNPWAAAAAAENARPF
jgi:sodium pump decarboxylase, gamma subunit